MKDTLRIAYFNDGMSTSGVDTSTMLVARALKKNGCHVTILVPWSETFAAEARDRRVLVTPAAAFPVGRAQRHASRFSYRTAAEPAISACSMASAPVIFPDGRVVACIGPVLTLPPRHPMFLGNLQRQTLPAVLDRAELNPVLHTIRVWGPQKLVSLLKENGYDAILPKAYICNCTCDVCYKLLSEGRIVAALEQILQNEQVRQTIAYGRRHAGGAQAVTAAGWRKRHARRTINP